MNLLPSFLEKKQIVKGKKVLKLFTTFIAVAAILASPMELLPGVIVPVIREFTE